MTKYLKMLLVQMNISNTNEHFIRILYTCIKFKMDDLSPFLFAQIDKIFLKKFAQMNISNINDYLFLILYTCSYYNPPMNSVKFCQDHIQNGLLIAIFEVSNWQNIWKFCPYGWISTPKNICLRYFTHAFTTILPWILITYNKVFTRWGIPLH